VRPGAIQNPDTTGASAVDVAFPIDFHAVGVPRLLTGHGAKDTICRQGTQACRLHIKGPNMSAVGVIDVEDIFVR